MQLRAHTENTVVQSIQDEIVLVNLESGIYYFLNGSAALIFALLDAGCAQESLLTKLTELFSTEVTNFSSEIDNFVSALLAESLMVEGAGNSGLIAEDFLSKPFVAPVLNKCEDLQDLLLLDPIVARASFDGQPES